MILHFFFILVWIGKAVCLYSWVCLSSKTLYHIKLYELNYASYKASTSVKAMRTQTDAKIMKKEKKTVHLHSTNSVWIGKCMLHSFAAVTATRWISFYFFCRMYYLLKTNTYTNIDVNSEPILVVIGAHIHFRNMNSSSKTRQADSLIFVSILSRYFHLLISSLSFHCLLILYHSFESNWWCAIYSGFLRQDFFFKELISIRLVFGVRVWINKNRRLRPSDRRPIDISRKVATNSLLQQYVCTVVPNVNTSKYVFECDFVSYPECVVGRCMCMTNAKMLRTDP